MRPLPSSFSVAVLVLVVAPSSDAAALNIALRGDTGSCYPQGGEVLPTVQNLLTARGHAVTIIDGSGLGTAPEVAAYDAVVIGAGDYACAWDWVTFKSQLPAFVSFVLLCFAALGLRWRRSARHGERLSLLPSN